MMLSSRRGVVVQNLICLVLKFSDGRPSEKHPATAVDTPGSARREEGGERDGERRRRSRLRRREDEESGKMRMRRKRRKDKKTERGT